MSEAAMSEARASVPTEAGAKYVQQLCKHWAHKLEVEHRDDAGIVRFPTSTATMRAEGEALAVRIEAEDAETLELMQGVVATHLDRFAFREAPLPFDWQRG